MAGVDTVLRLVGGTVALLFILFITAVGFTLFDAVYTNVIDPDLMTRLGWGSPQDVTGLFLGLALIGLSMTVIVWWLVAPVREDVRQDVRRGPPF